MVNIQGMQRTRNYISLKGINNVKSDARYSVNIQLYSRASKLQAEIACITLPKIAENMPARYTENDSWKLPAY
jgi:hypothetical protein